MTGAGWATYAGGTVAIIALCGFLWRRVLQPIAHGCARLMELLDRLFDVLDAWPEIQTSVMSQQTELTQLSIEMGELRGSDSQIKTDLDNAFDRIRELEETTHPPGSTP